jgi:hypothetical protein
MIASFPAAPTSTRAKSCLLATAIVALMAMNTNADEHSFNPPNGFVPDAATAVAVAEAILAPIYGRTQVEAERPFSASLGDGSWTVIGHLPAGSVGGVASVVIEKTTGRIVSVTHGQ